MMSFSPIIYYGKPGLEADIFQSYMRCSGYPVQVVTANSFDAPTIATLVPVVAVIALEKSAEELIRLVDALHRQGEGCIKRIFILADDNAPLPLIEPGVEVIQRPYRLSEVIRRIQALNRQN